MNRDNIYKTQVASVGNFEFDEHVAAVFPDMISRSVPGYASILAMIADLSEKYATSNTDILDLGCSLGAATLLMRQRIPATCTIRAVDSSPAMVNRLRDTLKSLEEKESKNGVKCCKTVVMESDIRDLDFDNVSFVVLNLTLQFIPQLDRQPLLQSAFEALKPGGGLLLAEKICFADPAQQQLLTELHLNFKRSHGYSELEISQKRTAIENMLVPETLEAHVERLRSVGFKTIAPWFQCFNFASVLAVKE